MAPIIILPGIGDSGPEHWQTKWQAADASAVRFAPTSWEEPELGDWIAALDRAVATFQGPPLLVAHSLACLLVAHWAERAARAVSGALLVAVPDADGPAFPPQAAGFAHPPERALPFPALIVASSDDPYASLAYTQTRADQWRTGLVVAGPLGHINGASDLGDWPQGRDLLTAFQAGGRL